MLEGHSVLLLEGHHHLVTEAKQHQLQQKQARGIKNDVRTIRSCDKEKTLMWCVTVTALTPKQAMFHI